MTKLNLLLTPGPTPIPPEILQVMARPIIHHRTHEYRAIFREVSEGLKEVFRTQNEVYTFTSSGTGAMEASVVNFVAPGESVLVLDGGKFGERFADIARAYGLDCDSLKVPYGESFDAAEVKKKLSAKKYKAVYATLLETSTGVVNDIEAIGKAVADSGALFAVDAISGLLADRLETDAWKVDLAISGSQKGLMLPPGLAFLAVSAKAKAAVKPGIGRFYFDSKLYEKALKDEDSPFTPAITIVLGLKKALEMIRAKGLEAVWRENERLAEMTREAVRAMGLEMFAKKPSNGVTAVKVPAGIDGSKLLKVLQDEYGVVMAGGQGEMKGKIFRVAHMGHITQDDLAQGFNCLEELLQKMGYSFTRGAGLKAFQAGARA
ncbi:MAG: alanine--glyoxylate aminotransferase family protein [Candidatus Omnitrophica bacterium]|nr:alanine--glyoxylate aminotransferase family protein [Candidatus Omnitrophota bacterium]